MALLTRTFSRRSAVLRIVAAVCVASLLTSLAIMIFLGVQRDIVALSEQIILTVFLESDSTPKDIATAQSDLKTIAGIDSVALQPSSDVKEAFLSRFATNIGSVLPENAFPTALIIRLKDDYRTKERIDSIVSEALGMQSVGNVSYRTGFVEAVEQRRRQEHTAMWLISCICTVVVMTLLWQALYRLPVRLQESSGAVLAGVLVAMFLGFAVFANVQHIFPPLEHGGLALCLKVQLLGSVSVCAFATVVLAVNTIQNARHHDDDGNMPSHPTPTSTTTSVQQGETE